MGWIAAIVFGAVMGMLWGLNEFLFNRPDRHD